MVIAEESGELLGCAAAEAHGEDTLLRSVASVPAARAAGLGARLAEAALLGAFARGARVAWLLTEGSEAFFAKRGFLRLARDEAPIWLQAHPQWRMQCSAAALVMRRKPASPDRLFVYGTLRSGSTVPAARELHARARSLGPAAIRGRVLPLVAYPGLVEQGESEVSGECFLLPEDPSDRESLLQFLDVYEGLGPNGEPGLPFHREARVIRDAAGASAPSWVYLWRGRLESTPL